MQIDIIVIQFRSHKLRQRVGVARGDRDDCFGVVLTVRQLIHDILIGIGVCPALGPGTKGKVHGIALEDKGVLDGRHIVRIIRAAGRSKDLHDQQLRIRRHADSMHVRGSIHVGIAALDIPVRSSDARHMGTVLTLRIVQMRNGRIPVHVVVSVGNFCGNIRCSADV